MQIIIYIIAALITNFVFSVVTSLLVVYGVDKSGGDPGAPIIMLVGLLFICGIFSILAAAAMGIAKTKYQKSFPARYSALIFLFTYFPFHIIGLYFSDEKPGILAAPLGTLTVLMLFFSYIPFFHMTAQGFLNLSEFVKKQDLAGKRHTKFIVLALLAVIILFVGWLIFKPVTQPSTGVLSLEDNWLLLETGGQDWQSDAYLQNIVFYPNSRLPYEISATYLSESTPEENYSIEINKRGEISKKETGETYPMRDSAKLPIHKEDWEIGSVQAWNLFMQNKRVNACVKPSENTAFFYMVLHRIPSGKLAWELSVSGCSTLENHSVYLLDARTGERIGSYFE